MPTTPTHFLLTRRLARFAFPGDRTARRLACAASVLPDWYYWWKAAQGLARDHRLDPAHIDAGRPTQWPDRALHTALPPAAVLALGAAARNRRIAALGAGWLAHVLLDIPVHDGSARAPLAPLSGWKFRSPLATDERGHHAGLVLAAEALLCAISVIPAQHVKVPAPHRQPARGRAGRLAMARAFTRDPRHVGTLWATGAGPGRTMLNLAAAELRTAVRVEEIGAGSGAITRLILERIGPAAIVDAYERDEDLHEILRGRFGDSGRLRLHYDAAAMGTVLDGAHADVIVSAYPWTSVPRTERDRMMRQACQCLRPGSGVMVAIQYSRHCEPWFREHFQDVRHVRHGRIRWPVLYRLARPREATGDAAAAEPA
jgi:phospholipid N-methyltransferase